MWISFGSILVSLFCVYTAFFVCTSGHFSKLNNFRAGKCDEIPGHGDGSGGGKMKKKLDQLKVVLFIGPRSPGPIYVSGLRNKQTSERGL